jgi:hypothetical protein
VWLRIHDRNRGISNELAQMKRGLESSTPATNEQKVGVHGLDPSHIRNSFQRIGLRLKNEQPKA